MNLFDNIVDDRLFESVVNISRDELDETVFQFREEGQPIIRDSIKVQILKDIDQLRTIIPVVNFWIIGSILTKNYSNKCDIDVTVQVDSELIDDIATAEIMFLLKRLNGKLAADTQHPLNYYITTEDLDDTKVEAVYDVVNEKWIKIPPHYEPDVEKWSVKFQDTLQSMDIASGQLRRDLIDLDEIRNLDSKNIKKLRLLLKSKLASIEEILKYMVTMYKDVKSIRKLAFDQFMTPQELQLYGTRNKLPENILYKLLEKYYYIKFIKKLEDILDDKGEFELSDVPKVKQVMSSIWKTS